MLSLRLAIVCAAVIGCHGDDPGFDVVRVPRTAYAAPDAGVHVDSGQGDAHEVMVVCIQELHDPGDEEMAQDYPSCPVKHEDRSFDERATERHRKRDDENTVCCYRR